YPGFVFDINNSQIESEWERNNSQIENEWERNSYAHQYTSSRHFIFWQTALADGFNPKYVSSYNCCNSLFDRIVLYCTVGPLRILEALIEAFEITLRFLIIPFIMRLFGKPLFFDDFKSFLKYVSK
ncbi:MAG TPA: hypothetical protein PLY70_11025, partial [Saprospiraceae bacterium]|nr:hypothetical protein [Saprospiraceae bacterium]